MGEIIEDPELRTEKMQGVIVGIIGHWMSDKASVVKAGQGDMLSKSEYEFGKAAGAGLQEDPKAGYKGKDIDSTINLETYAYTHVGGMKAEKVEVSAKKGIWRMHDCTYHKAMVDYPDLCEWCCWACQKGIVEACLGPEAKWEVTKTLKKGDPYCEFIITLP